MNLGALSSLAEVGIGINLAFGFVSQFRDRWQASLADAVERTTSTARLAAQEIRAQGELPASKWAATCKGLFARAASLLSVVFTGLSLAAAIALIGFLYYVIDHSTAACPLLYKRSILGLAVGPVFAWLALLTLLYVFIRASLFVMALHDKRFMGVFKGLRVNIQPIDPGAGASQPPPPALLSDRPPANRTPSDHPSDRPSSDRPRSDRPPPHQPSGRPPRVD
jgi:hypothetical protein